MIHIYLFSLTNIKTEINWFLRKNVTKGHREEREFIHFNFNVFIRESNRCDFYFLD